MAFGNIEDQEKNPVRPESAWGKGLMTSREPDCPQVFCINSRAISSNSEGRKGFEPRILYETEISIEREEGESSLKLPAPEEKRVGVRR